MNEQQKTQTNWRKYLWLIGLGCVVLALLTFLVLLQSSQIWKYFQVDTASDTLTLYALSSLNFFAFIVFAFIFLRSVVKLIRERRDFQIGAKLKTRLLVYFVAVSLLPIAAMAFFSYLFLNRALEKWFSRLPETVIEDARQIQKNALQAQVENFQAKARLFATLMEAKSEFDALDLRSLLLKGNLSAVEVFAPNDVVLAKVTLEFNEEQREKLQDILTVAVPDETWADGIGFDAVRIPLADERVVLVVSAWQGEMAFSQRISDSPFEFEKLKQQQVEVRQLGFSTLSLLTFLLIFAASWVSFHLGRGLTKPIRALAEGADEIARGNLKHRVDVLAEDELALLVDSFNQMSAQLEENQQNLEERRNYIETVLQSLSTGVISLDAENRVTTINQSTLEILNINKGDCQNCNLSQLLSVENRLIFERLLGRARRAGHATEQTVLWRENSNGNGHEAESLPAALTATALRGTDGEKSGAVIVIEDLTELLQAQRAAAWQEVARRMAHEIKNPLTPIQLAAERIAKRYKAERENGRNRESEKFVLTEDQRPKTRNQLGKIISEGTETILREVTSLKSMVDEFSRYARLPDVKLELRDLNEIARQTIVLYEDRLSGAKLETELAENLPSAMLDEEQLKRVFVNLIDNALESFSANDTDKMIYIKTWIDDKRDLLIAEVSDNGRGIAPQNFPKIFQPYFSTKGRGTGLGLAIVQRIITEHGGKIRAASNVPKGAKFWIELPIASM
jgi:PAS domain S-box-containing protein